LQDEVREALKGSATVDYGLTQLSDSRKLSKYKSLPDLELRRYSGDYFKRETGMTPKELESGLDTDDFKKV